MMELRAHHLLCLPMYQGHGYSEGFCGHMTKMLERIRTTDGPIRVLASPDEICAGCPHLCTDRNHVGPGSAGHDGYSGPEDMTKAKLIKYCDDEERISRKDRALLTAFHLEEGEGYDRLALKETVCTRMSEAVFLASCGKCQWLQEGLCSYSLWKKNFADTF